MICDTEGNSPSPSRARSLTRFAQHQESFVPKRIVASRPRFGVVPYRAPISLRTFAPRPASSGSSA
jgi:hypothetical protein